jgi:hypothetical protein
MAVAAISESLRATAVAPFSKTYDGEAGTDVPPSG